MTDEAQTAWSILVGQLLVAKQAIAEAEPGSSRPTPPPNPKATEAELAAFERDHEPLPVAYREFLSYANGWPRFYFGMDLFGLPQLSPTVDSVARRLLDGYDADEVLAHAGLQRDALLPIAAGTGMRHVVAIVRCGHQPAGQVTWLDGTEAGRYPDFFAFFAHMTKLYRRQAQRLREPDA